MGEEVGKGEAGKKEEVEELVNALKEAVMELRETLSELNNPLARLGGTQPQPREGGRGEGVEEASKSEGVVEEKPQEVTAPTLTVKEIVEPKLERFEGVERGGGAIGVDLKRALRMLKMIFELREAVEPPLLERYVDIFRKLGLVGESEKEVLKDLIDIAVEGGKAGLTAEDHIAVMALLAKTLGIQDKELEEESFKLLLRRVKDRVRGSGSSETYRAS